MRPTLFHYWRSSSSWRVRWALAIKGVAFESVVVDLLAGEQKSDAHRARNPVGHIPTLHVDGRYLSESVAILEYLEETIPDPPLYPRDAWGRARVRQLVELVNAGVQPLQNLIVLRRHAEDAAGQKAWAAFFNERGLAAYEATLAQLDAERGGGAAAGGRFSFGDALTAADLCLVPQVYSARRFGVDVARFPRVLAAEQAALATEHARGALPENQPGAPAPT
jgi:maleylacetoacetate isomerase